MVDDGGGEGFADGLAGARVCDELAYGGPGAVRQFDVVDAGDGFEDGAHIVGRAFDLHQGAVAALKPTREAFCGILGNDAAAVDDDHALARHAHLRQDVGAEQHGGRAPQGADESADLDDLAWIQADGGFVENEYLRLVQQRLRQPDPLAVPLRECADEAVGHLLQAAIPDHGIDTLALTSAVDATDLGAELQEPAHAHVRIKDNALRQVADLLPQRQRLIGDVEPGHPGMAGSGWEEAGQHAHDGGLARAVRPQQADDFALRHGERHVAHRARGTEILAEALDRDHR